MGIKLSELEEGSPVQLTLQIGDRTMQMNAVIKKHLKENIALITLKYDTSKRLVFDNVYITMEYSQEGNVPIVWSGAKIVSYKSEYIMQVLSDGIRHNRRNSFRVGVSTMARLHMSGDGPAEVMIRDISLSGFSITDRKKELNLNVGDELTVDFEDIGHILKLKGQVVRIETHPDITIYGLEICNLCKDLSSYVNLKQRRNKSQK